MTYPYVIGENGRVLVGKPECPEQWSPAVDYGTQYNPLYNYPNVFPPPGSRRFAYGGYYKQNSSPWYSYLAEWTVPAGMMCIIIGAGFDDLLYAKYTLFANGSPDPWIHDMSNYSWVELEDGNPPPASTYSGKGNGWLVTDGAVAGVRGMADWRQCPIVYGPGAILRLRADIKTALKEAACWLWGYHAPQTADWAGKV